MNARFPVVEATGKGWDLVEGWGIGGAGKVAAVSSIEGRTVSAVAVRGNTAIGKGAGSGLEAG